jgi:phosphatidylglycerophosphate synthase
MAAMIASDVLDGLTARKLSTESARGAFIDTICDLIVLGGAAVTLGFSDPRYLVFAGLIIACFASWAVHCLIRRRIAYTRLGRYDGTLCYVLVAAATAKPWLERAMPAQPLFGAAGISVTTTAEWVLMFIVAGYLVISTTENIVKTTTKARYKPKTSQISH